jgi:predicted permease
MESLWQDVRYGMRTLAKSPGFTIVAVLTLALGIGANTAIFSLLNQVLLRRLPVKSPDELVVLRAPGPRTGHVWSDGDSTETFSYPMYKGLREHNSVLSGLLARFAFAAGVTNHGKTERTSGELVSGNYFEVLGVRPILGRLFTLEDDRVQGGHPVVVLSYGYWIRSFGTDASILNQTILINNMQMTVVGVTQPGFTGIQVGQSPDVFVPLMMRAQMMPNVTTIKEGNGFENWNDYWLPVLGRVKRGVSPEQAEAGLNAAYRPLLQEQLPTLTKWNEAKRQKFLSGKILLSSGAHGRTTLQRDAGAPLVAVSFMAALVLLIACANIANLLLARGAARQREFSIRAAMGASRWRMMRQLFAENLLCAGAGGVLGLLVGAWTMGILIPAVGSGTGVEGLSSKLDGTILAFALGATLLASILFGLVPALRASRADVSQTLKDQGSTTSAGTSQVRVRKVLVGAQIAFTVLLLAGSGLFVRTLWNLRQVDLGFKTEHVATFSIAPELNGYSPARTVALCDQLNERLAALPGVDAVGSSQIPTLTGTNYGANITVPGSPDLPEDERNVNEDWISPGYFSTLGVPLLAGREFNAGDGPQSQKVAIVSQAMVRRFLPGRDPIGVRFAFGGATATPDVEIIGVVKDLKQGNVRGEIKPFVYQPYPQQPSLGEMTFYVRTQQDPAALAATFRHEVQQLDANLPVYDLKTLDRIVDEDLFAEQLVATLSASFGVLAALLASLGIYGVLAYMVVQRTREIGIRIAFGAETRHVHALIFREVGVMVIAGAAAGLPAAYALARFSESILFGVRSSDPAVYALDIVLIASVAFAACAIPARRAVRVDPIVALRHE